MTVKDLSITVSMEVCAYVVEGLCVAMSVEGYVSSVYVLDGVC